jgi:hypothetical protein
VTLSAAWLPKTRGAIVVRTSSTAWLRAAVAEVSSAATAITSNNGTRTQIIWPP